MSIHLACIGVSGLSKRQGRCGGWRPDLRSVITVALFCLFLCCGRVTYGLDPSTHISQYGHTAWRLGESGLDGLPTSITQSSDGYLWVGTADGLFRFDGIRLTRWVPLAGESLTMRRFDLSWVRETAVSMWQPKLAWHG